MYSCSKTVQDMVIVDMFPIDHYIPIVDKRVLGQDGEIMSF